MSATQLDKVFASLHKLERGMVGVSEHITTSRGEVSIGGEKTQRSPLTLYREDASVLNCKRGILSAQTSFDNMKQSIASLSNSSAMQSAEPLASLSELALRMQKTAAKSSRWRNLPLLCECAKAVGLCNYQSARHCTHSNTHKNEQEMFGLVALFAPVQAMRSLQNVKKSAGQALLQKFGVTGTHVNDQFLDKQLHKLFHDIDADGGGISILKK